MVCFFTRSIWNSVELYINDKLFSELKEGKFHDLTKTYILRMPRKLSVKNGDVITLKMPVEFRDHTNNLHKRIIEYKEIIILK
jgi:hypothetical protein